MSRSLPSAGAPLNNLRAARLAAGSRIGLNPNEALVSLAPGGRLGPYEILAPLGAGGMGEVYRARDTRLGRDVAIKVLPADRLTDEARRAPLRPGGPRRLRPQPSEHRHHPRDRVRRSRRLHRDGARARARPSRGSCSPRTGCPPPKRSASRSRSPTRSPPPTRRGIVHRDLKPANVMIGRDGVVKVLDFGLAKLVHDGTAGSRTCGPRRRRAAQPPRHRRRAPPAYLSPEQASGGEVDARSDVFSFGALLYEMVTGRRAFPGDSSTEAIAAVLRDQPKPPSELAPDVPREPGADRPALPAQGACPAIPAHGGREGRASGSEGGVGLAGRGAGGRGRCEAPFRGVGGWHWRRPASWSWPPPRL